MTRDPAQWQHLQALIDQALELEGAARADWLQRLDAGVPADGAAVRDFLQRAEAAAQAPQLEPPAWLSGAQRARDRSGREVAGYRLLAEIGRGGMGSVWKAAALADASQCAAIKFPEIRASRDAVLARFARERDLLARLDHPGIARLLDAGLAGDGEPFLILEYVDGVALDQWCQRHTANLAERMRLVEAVADAVQAAHAQLVVHRDLKPANVLVDGSGRAVVLDFGIARLIEDEGAGAGSVTRLHGGAMTPAYAAPEQLQGAPPSVAMDVYALGLIAYELVEGRRAFTATDTPRDPPPRARLADADLATIIAKAMRAEPRERYASAREFAEDLAAWRENRPIRARPPSLTYRARKFVRRHRGGVAAGMVALLAVIGSVIGVAWQAQVARAEAERARTEAARATAYSDFLTRLFGDALATGTAAESSRLLDRGEVILTRLRGLDPAVAAELWVRWAGFQFSRDRPAAALASYRRALALTPPTAFERYVNIECRTIGVHVALEEPAAAQALVAAAERNPHRVSEAALAECFDRAATYYAARGERERALASLDRAAAGYREREGADSTNAWNTQRRRAGLLIDLGRVDAAAAALAQLLEFRERAGLAEDTATASAYGELARVQRLRSHLPEALVAATRELELRAARGHDDVFQAAPHANIANLHALLGDAAAARRHYAEAERIAEQAQTKTMAPAIWLSHARWLIVWGEGEAAAERIDRAAQALVERHGATHPELARIAYLRSLLRIARGELDGGRADLAAAITLLRDAGAPVAMHLPRALTDQARHALAAGAREEARSSAQEALALPAPEYERQETRALMAAVQAR
ncbi:MAG: serine/threonine protein kinase [Xanthomonadales bacterium]|nr:serine/threonine protein kinase [Xanthomonadales bacterium]